MKKMTKRIALALSMVLFALAFTACGPNLLSGGDGGSKDTEGGIGDTAPYYTGGVRLYGAGGHEPGGI